MASDQVVSKKCSCKGCEKRHINCHSDCEEYKDYLNRIREIKRRESYDLVAKKDRDSGWSYSRSKRR